VLQRTEPAEEPSSAHDYRPDRVDLRLLHALQIEPRASWADLAPVVGADAANLSRRWRRLSEQGIAWVTGMIESPEVDRLGVALIELECAPGDLMATVRRLSADPEVATIDLTVGGRDLMVTVITDSPQQVADYVLHSLVRVPGIRAARTHLVTERLLDARRWRLRELSPAEVSAVPGPRPPRPRAARQVAPELRRALRQELAADGRATATGIAERHGLSVQRVTDAIASLRATGELYLRTDLTLSLSEWPVYTWYFLQVPARSMAQARVTLAQVPEVRLAALCASRYNLVLAVWLRSMHDVQAFEVALARALPGAVIADRSVVLRIAKHMWHVLDERGRATGEVVPLSGSALG
jgi:DNA-binding Lrp family transcriptional regulator